MIVNSLLHQITLGRDGKSWGYPMGLPKLEAIIDGVTKGTYTLLFSGTGSGKTSLALYSYIYKPIMEHLDDDNFKITYYSLEMSAELLFAKLLSIYIFEHYGIELSTKELLSRERGYVLNDDMYQIVQECIPWLHKIEKIITIFDKALNADTLYRHLHGELEKTGTFTKTESRTIYTPNNEDLIHLVVIDHLSLVRKSNNRSLKEEMDLISSYLVTLRNICKISPLVIMQANRDSTSMDRKKAGFDNLQISDIKDTGNPAQDAEIIISIFNPYREKLSNYKGYEIKCDNSNHYRGLGPNFRVITVLKNRYGESDVEDGCAFYGKCGIFAELPPADAIIDYFKYKNPDWISHTDNTELLADDTTQSDNETQESVKYIL